LQAEAQRRVGLIAESLHLDFTETELFAERAQRADLGGPALARNSITVPPAKSMPKFICTKTNSNTATIDSVADRG